MKHRLWPAAGLLSLAFCTSTPQGSTVEIYSWWVTGVEKASLKAVDDDFRASNPGVEVVNAAAQDAVAAQAELQSRMRIHDPPDLFQVNGGTELLEYDAGGPSSQLDTLNFLVPDAAVFAPEIVSAISPGKDGLIYAIPVDFARVNAIFYNVNAVGHLAATPTLDDLVAMAPGLVSRQINPIAIGDAAPWTLEVIFKSCMLEAGGASYYRQFRDGTNPYFGGTAPRDQIFDRAIECFRTIVSLTNETPSTMRMHQWNDAVDEVSSGKAAMTIMGDWALGEFLWNGQTSGVEFGEVPTPGSNGAFIYTTDTFVLPKNVQHRPDAIALLREWASVQGQSDFSLNKGTLPALVDLEAKASDPIQKQTWKDYQTAHTGHVAEPDWPLVVPQSFSALFDAALDRFIDDHNAENVVLAARNAYPLIVNNPNAWAAP